MTEKDNLELPPKIMDDVKKAFNELNPSEAQKKKILEKIKELYKKSCYEPGEAIGVVTAQSISEPGTQMTMRSYQLAGAVEIKVTLGLPRLIEIFDARKSPTTPTMTIYLKKEYNSKETAKRIATKIHENKLSDVLENSLLDIVNMSIEFILSDKKMKDISINKDKITEKLKEIKKITVSARTNSILVKPKTEMTIKELQKLKFKLMETYIKGIKGIEQGIVHEEYNEWVIKTLGSNLSDIINLKEVDIKRITTNNIYEILEVFGVEATRAAIINETVKTLRDQGLDVDIRHIILLADLMTVDGTIKSIGRYGLAGSKGSVLARANFEETIKHLINASTAGEIDRLNSIVENVMINQVVPIGTGMFGLIYQPKKKNK